MLALKPVKDLRFGIKTSTFVIFAGYLSVTFRSPHLNLVPLTKMRICDIVQKLDSTASIAFLFQRQ